MLVAMAGCARSNAPATVAARAAADETPEHTFPAAKAAPIRRPVKPYASRELGWSIDLGVPWFEWPAVRDRVPVAEYGATCCDASVVIPAVPLLGLRPPAEITVPGLPCLLGVWNATELVP